MAGWLATLAQDIFFGGAAAAAADDRVVAPELEDTDSPYPLLLLSLPLLTEDESFMPSSPC